jgi:type IV secretory pathway VirB2 component (pilin)
MTVLSRLLPIALIFLAICVGEASAVCNSGHIWSDSSCPPEKAIQYCSHGDKQCTLSGSISAVETFVGNGTFTNKPLSAFIQDIVKYFLGFVTLIAVIYIIYAGFQLMTGGADEEKVKKARQIITYVIAGIVLMWVAYWIVDIIIKAFK